MTTEKIIDYILDKDYIIDVEGDELLLDTRNQIPEQELIALIKSNKTGIINYIKKNKYKNTQIPNCSSCSQYPASSHQSRIFTMQELDKKSTAYNMPAFFEIKGKLNVEKLSEGFQKIVDRHEAFRTFFELDAEGLVQKIEENLLFSVNHIKVKNNYVEDNIQSFVKAFELCKAPLLRVNLFEINSASFILAIDMHHIISDGVSIGIFMNELNLIYQGVDFEQLRIQYKDFAAWEKSEYRKQEIEQQKKYWNNTFSTSPPLINIPTDYPRSRIIDDKGGEYFYNLTKDLSQKIISLCEKTNTTLFNFILSIYNLMLSKYSGEEDIVVGTVNAGRDNEDTKKLIGMFANTLALRTQVASKKSFSEYLQEVKANCLQAFDNQHYPFEELVKDLKLERDISHNPLFDTMFIFQNFENAHLQLGDLEIKGYKYNVNKSKFDICLNGYIKNGQLFFKIEYKASLFKNSTIAKMASHLCHITEQVVEKPNILLADIILLTKEEKKLVLENFNNTRTERKENINLIDLFEKQVQENTNSPAVIFGEEEITFKELNRRVNKLAHILRIKGVKPNDIIGIYLERSAEMVVAILSVWKAGGAYTPIPIDMPTERINYIISETKLKLLITSENCFKNAISSEQLLINTIEFTSGNETNPINITLPEHLAYVIFTSGTTGKPKGVLIEHKGICNTLQWRINEYKMTHSHKSLQLFNYAFDGFLTSCFTPLFSGSSVYITDEKESKDSILIRDIIKKHKISHVLSVPAILQMVLDVSEPGHLTSLQTITLAGDKLEQQLIEDLNFKIPNAEVINEYGPTESSVAATFKRNVKSNELISIGKPIDNTSILILDKNKNLVPIGQYGEINIIGDGLAKGYLNNAHLTEQKFYVHPLSKGKKAYKTGDIGRWLQNGDIQISGRVDNQVKMHGYRIEPGEIESLIKQITGIKEVVVVLSEIAETKNKTLCAYLVTEKAFDKNSLNIKLAEKLPGYMIPSHFITLKKLPLTAIGKINYKELPQPTFTANRILLKPSNEIERKLAKVWSKLLGIHENMIGVNDNFFSLGGNSLLILRMLSGIKDELEFQISAQEIYNNPTLKKLSDCLLEYKGSCSFKLSKAPESEDYLVIDQQIDDWILNKFHNNSLSIGNVVSKQEYPKLNKPAFEEAVKDLIIRYELLRTVYILKNGTIRQKILQRNEIGNHIKYLSIDELKETYYGDGAHLKLDLENGPVFKIDVYQKHNGENTIIFILSHMITDGVKLKTLLSELREIYENKCIGKLTKLPEIEFQFKDFCYSLNKYKKTNGEKHLDYWRTKLTKDIGNLTFASTEKYASIKKKRTEDLEMFKNKLHNINLKLDISLLYVLPRFNLEKGNQYIRIIDKDKIGKLNKLAAENKVNLFVVISTIFYFLIHHYTKKKDIVIAFPETLRKTDESANVLGWLSSGVIVAEKISSKTKFNKLMKLVEKDFSEASENCYYSMQNLFKKFNISEIFNIPVHLNYFTADKSIKDYDIQEYLNKHSSNGINKMWELNVTMHKCNDGLLQFIRYKTSLFSEKEIEKMFTIFDNIIEVVYNDSKVILHDVLLSI